MSPPRQHNVIDKHDVTDGGESKRKVPVVGGSRTADRVGPTASSAARRIKRVPGVRIQLVTARAANEVGLSGVTSTNRPLRSFAAHVHPRVLAVVQKRMSPSIDPTYQAVTRHAFRTSLQHSDQARQRI